MSLRSIALPVNPGAILVSNMWSSDSSLLDRNSVKNTGHIPSFVALDVFWGAAIE